MVWRISIYSIRLELHEALQSVKHLQSPPRQNGDIEQGKVRDSSEPDGHHARARE